MSGFFAFGTLMSGTAAVALLTPGGVLEPVWQVNPDARTRLVALGTGGVALMLAVCVACALSAVGLWRRARWGLRLALGVLTLNLIGDTMNAVLRHDARTLVGLPVGGVMIMYLLSAGVRRRFEST